MNLLDLVAIIENVSQSFGEIQRVVGGLSYVLGIVFIITAFLKFKSIAEQAGNSQEKMFVPAAYLMGGAALLFLPTAIKMFSDTAFGVSNILAYRNYNPNNLFDAMTIIIRTAGVIWFARGCVLLVQASEPGVQHGPKGLTFLIAGIFAMNFEMTYAYLVWVVDKITSYTSLKSPENPS